MNELTLLQFRTLINNLDNLQATYNSSNNNIITPCIVKQAFDNIVVTLNPDIISLVNAYGSVSFYNVVAVYIKDYTPISYTFNIVCNNFFNAEPLQTDILVTFNKKMEGE